MKGKISKWLAMVLVLVMLTGSGVTAEDVAQMSTAGTSSESEILEMSETGVETTTAPEAATEPEVTAAPELVAALGSESDSCTHANQETSIFRYGEKYSAGDADGHTVSYYAVTGHYCPDCGKIWEDAWPAEKTEEYQSHSFDNGVCLYCGYACMHANQETGVSLYDVEYIAEDAEGHTYSYYAVTDHYCPDCGKSWEDAWPTEKTVEHQSHSFENGACRYCGYENPCAHTNLSGWTNRYGAEYSDINADGHTVSYYAVATHHCLDCGIAWDDAWPAEKTVEREEHFSVDGVCQNCGYGNPCAHANRDSGVHRYDEEYSDIDADGHTLSYYEVTVHNCLDCGMSWNDAWPAEKTVEREAHYFENDICNFCGYENLCTHENQNSWANRYDEGYSDIDADGHTASYYAVTSHYCPDCGKNWNDAWPSEKTVEREAHYFVGGVCDRCGYACAHVNEETWTDRYANEYSDVDADGHTLSYYEVTWHSCTDCGMRWQDAWPAEKTEEREAHYFENGVCRYCGYACAHINQETWTNRYADEYSDMDADGHTHSYYAVTNHSCPDCGKNWNDAWPSEKTQEREAHIFSSGVCQCGYECTHVNLEVHDTQIDGQYVKIDDYMHLYSYTPSKQYYCDDCYKSWTESTGEPVSQKQMHYWDSAGECYDCGAVNACTHPNKVLLNEYCYADEGQCVDDGESGHTILAGIKDQEWFCYDCNQYIYIEGIELPGTGVQEPHRYVEEGVCFMCGHENPCAHENSYVRSVWASDEESVRIEGESGHTLVNAGLEICHICNDCGQEWYQYMPGEDHFEPHDFSEGNRCYVCGYETANPCTHPNAEQWISYEMVDADSYENAGAEGHYAVCVRKLNYSCPDCGAWWSEKDETAARMLIPHEFYGRRCVCGYVNNCTHENLIIGESAGGTNTYVNPDAEGHTCIAVIDCTKQCADCGEWFNTAQETQITREPHEFINDKCFWCNYVYVAPTATPEPTLTPAPTATAEPTMPAVTDEPVVTPAPTAEPTAPVETNEPEITPEPTMPAVTDEPVVTPAPSAEPTAPVETNEPEITPEPTMPAVTDEPVVTPAPTAPVETNEPEITPEPTMPAVTDEPVVTPAPTATAEPTERPTAAPTATVAPTATPAPVYTQLPENEGLHGVKVEDAPKLVETISKVAEELENQGANVQVQLANVDNVVTAEEKTRLDTLPLKEQMFTVLSVIGFEDVVSRTLEAEGEELSAEAQALKDEIQARVAAMTEEEYAEFEAMLMESFPQETVVIDGVEYTFFTLELEVREGDTVRYERYGFRLEGEEWILTRLEVA